MVTQLIYVSQPFGFEAPILNGILVDARRNNRRAGITGALVCRCDIYLQLLEGPLRAVEAAYRRIACDDRHADVHRLMVTETDKRLFPTWDMLDDPARSWLWSPKQVAAGDVARASAEELVAVFERIARDLTQVDKEADLSRSTC